MKTLIKRILSRITAVTLALMIVSGVVPVQPFSQLFDMMTITAHAATNIEPTPKKYLVAEKNHYGGWMSQELINAGIYDEKPGYGYYYQLEILEIDDDTISNGMKQEIIDDNKIQYGFGDVFLQNIPIGSYPGKYRVTYGISNDQYYVKDTKSFDVIIAKEETEIELPEFLKPYANGGKVLEFGDDEICYYNTGKYEYFDVVYNGKCYASSYSVAVNSYGNLEINNAETIIEPPTEKGSWFAEFKKGKLYVSWLAAHSVTIADGIENGTITPDKETAKKGDKVNLTVTPAENCNVNIVSVNGIEINAVDGVYSFEMPDEDVTVSAEFNEARPSVTYIGEDGKEETITYYTVLTSNKTTLTSGTYVVIEDVNYTSQLTIKGNVKIILCDGKTLNVTTDEKYQSVLLNSTDGNGNKSSLTIYGQEKQSGKFNIINTKGKFAFAGYAPVTINGGDITFEAPDELYSTDYTAISLSSSLTINNGKVKAKSFNGISGDKDITINGGQVEISSLGGNAGCDNVVIGADKETDYIKFGEIKEHKYNKYNIAGYIKIADGQTLVDQNGKPYYGTIKLKDDDKSKGEMLAGKKFVRAYTITLPESTANGNIAVDKHYVAATDEDKTVTLTVLPDEGYALSSLSVTKTGDPETTVEVINNTFTMPDYDVTVTAKFDNHTHSFTYTAEGETITAACANNDGNCPLQDKKVTLTIEKPDKTTYGDSNSAGAKLTGRVDFNSATGLGIAESDIKYVGRGSTTYSESTTAPAGAGDYTASITAGGETAGVDYTIAKANPSYTAPMGLTATFGQTLANVSLESYSGWAWKNPATSVGNVGTHTFPAIFTPNDTGNYNTVELNLPVTVDKAANPATITATATVTKGGNKIDLANNVLKNDASGTVYYSIAGEANGCTLSGSELTSGTDTGTVAVNVTIEADDNYEALESETITVTITDKNTQTLAFDRDEVTKTYGDAPFTNALSGVNTTITYAVTDGTDVAEVNSSSGEVMIKKAGTATITATAEETTDYAGATTSYTLKVNRKAVTVKAPKAITGLVYNGTAQALVEPGEAENGTMYYAVTTDNTAPADNLYTTSNYTATNAGTYKVWYKVIGDKNHNYNNLETQKINVTIAKPENNNLNVSMEGWTYGDEQTSPEVTGLGYATADITYSNKEDGTYTTEKPLTPGTWWVKANVAETANYPAGEAVDDFEITKRPLQITAVAKSKKFGESDPELTYTSEGLVENDKITGTLTRTAGENPGTYAITQGTLTAGDNYEISYVGANLTIGQATSISGAPEASKSVDYTIDTVGKVELPANWTWKMADINKELTVGAAVEAKAEYTGTDKDNYVDAVKTVKVSITRNACTHDNLEEVSEVPASCTKEGVLAHSKCPVCNKLFVKDDDKLVEKTADELKIEAVGHSYGKATYSWSDDHATCTATKVCVREGCDENSEGHVVTETVKTTSKTTPAGCEEKGVITYTATFTDKDFGTVTDSVDIAAKNHDYVITYEWSEDGKTCTATAVCKNDSTHKVTETAEYKADKETSKIKATVKETATTEKMGTTTYTASFENALFAAQTKDVVDIPKVENPAENPSENPSQGGQDNPQQGNDSSQDNKKSEQTAADKPQEIVTDKPQEIVTDKPSEKTADTPATPVENKTTTVVKEEGTTIPVADNKAEVVVTSKPGEEPSVAYKGTTDESAKAIEIPETVVSNGVTYAVTEISEGAFENNKTVESVKLGDNITTLGENAFAGCTNLKSVELPKNIKELPKGAFKDCTLLKKVDIPKNVKIIGDKTFSGCSKLATMNLKNNVTEIGEKAFEGCTSLKKVTLGKNVTKIGGKAFNGAKKLKTITIQSKKLTKKSVKGAFKGSKINIIKIDTGSKAQNMKLVKKYKKIFTKKNTGRKVIIK